MEKPTRPSRRERPAKPPLTRQGVIEAALDIMRREGLNRVTMRRIAEALDTGPASLYVYVRGVGDLQAQILDALLATVAVREAGAWRDQLKGLLIRYMDVLYRHPEIARMAMTTLPSGPNYLALVDAMIGLLNVGGVADRDAAWAVDLLLLYATANAAEHGGWATSDLIGGEFQTLATAIETADARTYPNVARLGAQLMSGGGARGRWSLDVLINGVLQTPRPTAAEDGA